MEEWKVCPTWPRFEVSNLGNIRHTRTKLPKYKNVNKVGYYLVQARIDGKIYTLKLHRLVAETWLEPPSKELLDLCKSTHHGVVCVNHKDGNKLNNTVENLEWCSHEQNVKHAYKNDMIPYLKGSMNGMSKLEEQDVHIICKMFEDDYSVKTVIERFPNISRAQITKIRAGHAWKHVWSLYDIKVNRRSKKFND